MVKENLPRKMVLLLLHELKKEAENGDKYAKDCLSTIANAHTCQKHVFGHPLCNRKASHWEFAEYEKKWIPICEKHGPPNLGRIVIKPDWIPENED